LHYSIHNRNKDIYLKIYIKQSIIFWLLAFLITVSAAIYQRRTGPTYEIDGKVILNGKTIKYELERSHAGDSNHPVIIQTNDSSVTGFILWKRFRTSDEWTLVKMRYLDGVLSAQLPKQPQAGKLVYSVTLQDARHTITLPEHNPVVIRFRGDVPTVILIIHAGLMFIGLVFSTRAGLEYFCKNPKLKTNIAWSIGLFAVGGLIFGPIVQKYAFGAFWTGWPFGADLTDNKTAVMVFVWILAAVAYKKFKNPKRWVLAAAIITLVVHLVPHSMLGSEFDYSKTDQQNISRVLR
jgi:hypothetical protein